LDKKKGGFMKIQRILHSFMIGAAVLIVLSMTGEAFAQEYPTRPITVLCWSSPGAPNDLLARQIAKTGEKYFGQRMDVVTKKGGGGAVLMAYMAKQKKDGYTLSTTTVSQIVTIAAGRVPFKIKDFTYIMRIQSDPYMIAVRSDSPFKDLKGFFEYAKKNPGKLSVSGFGTASAHFLAFMRLRARAGDPNIRWVAYEGGADAAVACLGGHVNAVHTNYSVLGQYVKAGKMRVLGVSSDKRLSFLPDVPTYMEQGYQLAPNHWRGLMGPAGIPPAVVKKIRSDMEKTVADPEFKKFMANAGAEYGLMGSQEELQKWVGGEVSEYYDLLKKLNLLGKKKKK
jgi:putative tricarboxylic transport membrane protein